MPIELNEDGSFPMWRDANGRWKPTPAAEATLQGGAGGGPHTHPESDVTNLTADLAAKAPTHAHPYAATVHGHAIADTTNLQTTLDGKAATGHNHTGTYEPAGAVATHAGLADPHPGYLTPAEGNAAYATAAHTHVLADQDIPAAIARDAEVTSAIATHAATPHGGSLPAGLIVMWGGLVANIPSGWALCDGQNGTPDLRDRFIRGAAAGQNPGATGGAATHSHSFTQPIDHPALTHSGATVANHTDVVNHVHVEQLQGGTTGTTTGTHLMGSAATGGNLRSAGQSTLNPTTVGVAAQVHTVGQASQHPAQSHSGGAVADGSTLPPYYALCFIQKT